MTKPNLKCPNCGQSNAFRLFTSVHDVNAESEVIAEKNGTMQGYLCLGSAEEPCRMFLPVTAFECIDGEPVGSMPGDPF